jgi:hypothetical protein
MAGVDPSSVDIVTTEELELERIVALARAAMDGRLLVALDAAGRQQLELARDAGAVVDPERRSPVSSRAPHAPHTAGTTTPRSPVSSHDNTEGEPL